MKKYWFLILLIIFLPYLLRFIQYDNMLSGQESYFYLSTLKQGAVSDPYDFLVISLSNITGLENAMLVLQLLSSLSILYIFYLLLGKFQMNSDKKHITLIIFGTSPIFIYLAFISTKFTLALLTGMIAFLLLLSCPFYSIPFFLLSSTFGLVNSFVSAALLILWSYYKKEKLMPLIMAASIIMISLFLHSYYPQPVFELNVNYISELGSDIGFGIFHLVLAFMGAIILWKSKTAKKLIDLLSIIAFFLMFYFNQLMIYLNLLVCYLSASAFYELMKREWEIDLVKKLTLLVLVCGLLFSSLSYINRISKALPDDEMKLALDWLKDQQDGTILSHDSRAYFIQGISEKEAFANTAIAEQIFYSRDFKNTASLLESNSIKYIFIDKGMKQGLVWKKQDQGLLFLFTNPAFQKIYSTAAVDIWRFQDAHNS